MLLAVILGLIACSPASEAPSRDPDAPRVYRVLRGDTLATIASKRSTTPDLLRRWNDLPEGEPAPGTILLIYRGTTVPDATPGTHARPLVINDPEFEPDDPEVEPVAAEPIAPTASTLAATPELPRKAPRATPCASLI